MNEPQDMRGKTVLLTGITSGIGKATMWRLAGAGARVLGVARDAKRGEAAVAEVRAARLPGPVTLLVADLSRQADVRSLAKEASDQGSTIDVLINNAAVAKFERQVSADGIELMLATNHLAPFLLTNLLLDSLEKKNGARIITVSSDVHKQVKVIPWDDLQAERKFNPLMGYNVSKLMNILFTVELAKKLDGSRITANCLTPGFLHTGLSRDASGGFAFFFAMARPFQRSPEVGMREIYHLAASSDVDGVSGRYFKKGKPIEATALATDPGNAARLWQISAEMTGLVP